ncbi:MAG TPA: AAA family ATPase [Solirubrobacteraceae bacterium]|nr:AAA family ATPase [Solirubrobacteraceae bacterium]
MQSGRAGDPGALRTEPWARLDGLPGWQHLVLPPATLEQLRAVPPQFGERFWTTSAASLGALGANGKRGVLLLFGGPSGTGKTMAARALAGALALPVLQADLETMFSRGRGEATQLVARLFATSQRLGAVLVLDRADDVLRAASSGSAPGVAGMAAIDVRDLLRRSEAHPGVVIFPATVTGELSPSTLERFDQVIEFPFPDRSARAEIWRRALPDGARVHEDDVTFLARAFELPGRQIADCCTQAQRAALGAGRALLLGDVTDVLERTPGLAAGALAELRRRAGSAPVGPEAAEAQGVAPEAAEGHGLASAPVEPPEPESAGPEPAEPEPAWPAEPETAEPGRAESETSAPEPEPEPAVVAAPRPGPIIIPEPARRTRGRRPRRPARAGASSGVRMTGRGLATVALLGALGAVVLGLSASEPPSHTHTTTITASGDLAFDRTATIGLVSFQYPAAWRLTPARHDPGPGLSYSQAVTVASVGTPRGQLTVGTTASRGTGTPLPTRFLAAELTGTPAPQGVTLGANRFYRVLDPLLPLGAKSESVYALASGTGAVVALCQTRTQSFVALCERMLATLSAPAPRIAPSKPSAAQVAYARSLNAVISKLNAGRVHGADQLAAAHVALEQATADRALALVHSEAANAVAALTPPPSAAAANAALVTALRHVSAVYTELGDAAAVVAPVTYNADRKLLAPADSALAAALGKLKALGYSVG